MVKARTRLPGAINGHSLSSFNATATTKGVTSTLPLTAAAAAAAAGGVHRKLTRTAYLGSRLQRKGCVTTRAAMLCGASCLTLMLCMSHAQPVSMETVKGAPRGAGAPTPCISDRPPSAPANIKASPKDGGMVVTWDPPTDGACVDTYVVHVVDPMYRSAGASQSTSTSGLLASFKDLANAKPYVFSVQAYSGQHRSGGTGQVIAAPSERCNTAAAPSAPTGLRTAPAGDSRATLCWDGVSNDACVSEYKVSAVPLAGPGFRSAGDDTISRGACVNISGLINDAQYNFTVTPYGPSKGKGQAASITAWVSASAAVARGGWRCKPVEGCPPGRMGMCANAGGSSGSTGGCDAVRGRNMCRLDATLTDIDFSSREITQWCSPQCACPEMTSTLGSMRERIERGGTGLGANSRSASTAALARLTNGINGISSGLGSSGSGSSVLAGMGSLGSLGSSMGLSGLMPATASNSGSSAAGSVLAGLGGGNAGAASPISALASGGAGGLAGGLSGVLPGGLPGGGLGSGGYAASAMSSAQAAMESMANSMIDSGVIGEAIGKMAANTVTQGVQRVVQQFSGAP